MIENALDGFSTAALAMDTMGSAGTGGAYAVATSARPGYRDIEALGHLATEADIVDALGRIAGAYGRVLSIRPTDIETVGELRKHMFLVHYEHTEDAISAAGALRCYLFGFSTLVVSVCRDAIPLPELHRRQLRTD